MKELYKQQPKKPPKQLSAWQWWAKQHKEEVAELAGTGAGIDGWNEASRALFGELDEDAKKEAAEQAVKAHEAALERFNNPLDGLPSASSTDRAL